MGFGEFIGDFFEGVAMVFQPVVEFFQGTVGVIAKGGAYVVEKAKEIIEYIGDPGLDSLCNTLEEASVFLNEIGDYLLGIGNDLDIAELKDCKSEDLGAKVFLPDTRQRDVDETSLHYIDYLNTVDLNRAEFESWSPEKKVTSEAVGNALITEAIKEKTGVEIPTDFVANMEKAEVKHEEVSKIIEEFGKEGIESMSEMNDVITNSPDLNLEKVEKVESIITEALKELTPELSDEDAGERLKEIKIAVQTPENKE